MPTKLNPEIIAAAIEGFENQKNRLDAQIGELRAMLNGGRTESAPPNRRNVNGGGSVPLGGSESPKRSESGGRRPSSSQRLPYK